jgi:acyl-CoA hydrolase
MIVVTRAVAPARCRTFRFRQCDPLMVDPREPTLRVTMLPRDTNARGTIFGGVILSHIDLAGAIAASRQASRNFVTRAMREVGLSPRSMSGMW